MLAAVFLAFLVVVGGPSLTTTSITVTANAADSAASVVNDDDASTEAVTSGDGSGIPSKLITNISFDLPRVARRRTKASGLEDQDERCAEWASSGECESNPSYMLENCAASCSGDDVADDNDDDDDDGKQRKGEARVYEGEDAAIGAFRFVEEYASYYPNGVVPTGTVLNFARALVEQGPDNYAPPTSVTHCGGDGKKKSRPCSAGNLWKRAEEFRKDDMYDAAGADLIRILLKTGLEVDFVEKCERSLQWAIGSIRRQRDRERKAAEEEAKLEKRREEERNAQLEAEERKKAYEEDFVKFGQGLQVSLLNSHSTSATVGVDGSMEIDDDANRLLLITSVITTFTESGPQGGQWNETLQLMKKISPSHKTVDVLLIEARCHEMLGNHKQAMSAAAKLISKAASYGTWSNDSPGVMAATLGANSAMQLGLSENAISFYQSVLKLDPEQDRCSKQYRGLKKVVKLLNKVEDQIQKGYNNAASGFIDDCLSAMRGLDVDSPLFRSKIQLKQCTILSSMGKYEEALDYCDKAVDLRLANADLVSPVLLKEAHLVRADALLLDMDYDDAVSDLRAAFDLVPEEQESMQEKRELQQRLQQAQHQQQLWNGGTKDQRYNEHTGYPDGRPPERDHAKILQLPIDLDQRTKDIKCAWLKKQFKSLARQYHPDKYKGNKRRAGRKFKEVKEAKEIISNSWGC
jgi:tetratricopeptide (TPR) repeat protein